MGKYYTETSSDEIYHSDINEPSEPYKTFKSPSYEPYKSPSYEPNKSPRYEPYKRPSYEPYKSPSYEPHKSSSTEVYKNPCYNSSPSYKPYSSSMDEYSCSAVEEEFTNHCKQSNATCGACLPNHSINPHQTDLETKERELISWVWESPKGINQSLDQPSTSYRAKGEKEKNPQKDDNHVVNSTSSDSLHHVIKRKVFRKRKKRDNPVKSTCQKV